LALLGFPATASAQDPDGLITVVGLLHELNRVVDLSLGFSVARAINAPGIERLIPIGLQMGATTHVYKSIGIDADLAVQSRTPTGSSEPSNMLEYLFGPCISVGTTRTTVFGHALYGGVHHWQNTPRSAPATDKGGGFAMAYGCGVDVNVGERIAFRV